MDRREAILARLEAVLADLAGAAGGEAHRNLTDIPDRPRPLIVLLDGDEETAEGTKRGGGSPPATVPAIVTMMPEVYVLDADRAEAEAGPALNAMRARIIHAVLTDAALTALCHAGTMRYDGMATGFAAGRSLLGEAAMNFAFSYVLRPADAPAA